MPLDVFQQVFSLSLSSNLANYYNGSQEALQKWLQEVLPSTFPSEEWKVVWGPVVWKHLEPDNAETGPDNTWYVAYHPQFQFEDGSVHPTYVVAVAGTPPRARHVWETQNFAVDTVADFNAWVAQGIWTPPAVVEAKDIVAGKPYIATGTVNTVHFLLTTSPPPGAASADIPLIDFLTGVNAPLTRIITTGHSLGGALSPSLAMSLVHGGISPREATLTYPTAGASPGNIAFSNFFTETFPPRKHGDSYQGWNLNWVNTLDIVPQAWCTLKSVSKEQNVFNIPPIYGRPIVLFARGTAKLLAFQASKSRVRYKPLQSQYFMGCFPPTPPRNFREFMDIALREHGEAYYDAAGVPVPNVPHIPPVISEKTEIEERFNYPIIAGMEWALEHPEEAQEVFDEIGDQPDEGEDA